MQEPRLDQGHDHGDRDDEDADPEEQPEPPAVHAERGGEDLAPGAAAGEPERRRGPPGRAAAREDDRRDQQCEDHERCPRAVDAPPQRVGACGDRAAEEVGSARPERAGSGDGDAPVAPVLGPRDRLGPLGLQVRSRRPVEERGLELAPAAGEADPGERSERRLRVARDRVDDRTDVDRRALRVVAADAFRGRAAEIQRLAVEVRVRARGRMHDGVRAVDELELVVAPVRSLGALVLAVADGGRLGRERLGGAIRVEVELDHLPVALVRVVPVVEDVEEPVLKGELPGVGGLCRDMRVDRRFRPLRDPPFPALVVAPGIERIAGEVEVVLVAGRREIARRRRDLHEVAAPRSAERDGRLVEERVDVDRDVRLPGTALVGLRNEPHVRCVALRERLLVLSGSRRGRRRDERERRGEDQERASHCSGFDTNRSSPRLWESNLAASWPLTLFPAASRRGANVPRPPLPGATVTMPPPIPLLPGRPTS